MPFIQEKFFSVDNHHFYTSNLDRFNAFTARQTNRCEPKFTFAITGVGVDVRRLGTLI